jgi:hypothetical protein
MCKPALQVVILVPACSVCLTGLGGLSRDCQSPTGFTVCFAILCLRKHEQGQDLRGVHITG